jgi:hypothetical protein
MEHHSRNVRHSSGTYRAPSTMYDAHAPLRKFLSHFRLFFADILTFQTPNTVPNAMPLAARILTKLVSPTRVQFTRFPVHTSLTRMAVSFSFTAFISLV